MSKLVHQFVVFARNCALFILLFCYSVGGQSKCFQNPVSELPKGCEIGNLIVTSSYSQNNIIDDASCDHKTSSDSFSFPPEISLRRDYNSRMLKSNATYLLAVIDRTNKKLIWMVSNMTVNKKEIKANDFGVVMPLAIHNTDSQHIIPYHELDFENKSNITMEFLIFEERRSNTLNSYKDTHSTIAYNSPFNLSVWIDFQKRNSEITICGPVAGGSVMVWGMPAVFNIKQTISSMPSTFLSGIASRIFNGVEKTNVDPGDNNREVNPVVFPGSYIIPNEKSNFSTMNEGMRDFSSSNFVDNTATNSNLDDHDSGTDVHSTNIDDVFVRTPQKETSSKNAIGVLVFFAALCLGTLFCLLQCGVLKQTTNRSDSESDAI